MTAVSSSPPRCLFFFLGRIEILKFFVISDFNYTCNTLKYYFKLLQVYIYICTCIHIYIDTYIRIYAYTYIHDRRFLGSSQLSVCLSVCLSICLSVWCILKFFWISVKVYIYTCIHTYLYMYTYTHTCTYTHIHTYRP